MKREETPAISCSLPSFPQPALHRWFRPLVRFLQVESAGGLVLLTFTLVGLGLANSPWAETFFQFWETRLGFFLGGYEWSGSFLFWVNDGLMTIFFFVAGLEIKREVVIGEFRDLRKAALPILAALGGMVAPACIYWCLRGGKLGQEGWGIPMATDIAFAIGFLALLGSRVPLGLKMVLLTLAIADDIGAVLVIVVFYSGNISLHALGLAALGPGLILLLNRIGVRPISVYVLVAVFIWLAFWESGVHPAVAGVLLGLLTPATTRGEGRGVRGENKKQQTLDDREATLASHLSPLAPHLSPLARLETALHPWVAFGIMPLFALANAGVAITPAAFGHPVVFAVAAGLVLGKPLGIVLFSWLAVSLGLARLPAGVNWRLLLGAGCLGGIGFTMSLFVTGLAFEGELLEAGKIGTLTGSSMSALLGSLVLLAFLPRPAQQRYPAMEVAHVD